MSSPADADAVRVWDALEGVYDPELGIDIVTLGLVYRVEAGPRGVAVEMTLTTPGCPASDALSEMAEVAVRGAVDDATPVEVRIVWDPPWNPSMIRTAESGPVRPAA